MSSVQSPRALTTARSDWGSVAAAALGRQQIWAGRSPRIAMKRKGHQRAAMLTLGTPSPASLAPFPPTSSQYFCQNTEYIHSAPLSVTNLGFKNKQDWIFLQELKPFQWGSLIFVFILPCTLLSYLQCNKGKLMLNRLPSSNIFNRKCVLLKAKEVGGDKGGSKDWHIYSKILCLLLFTCQSWTARALCLLLYLMTSLTPKALKGMQLRAVSGVIYATSYLKEITGAWGPELRSWKVRNFQVSFK